MSAENKELGTGDTVKNIHDEYVWTVACVIDGRVYRTGEELIWSLAETLELVSKGSPQFKRFCLNILSRLPVGDIRKRYAVMELDKDRMDNGQSTQNRTGGPLGPIGQNLEFLREVLHNPQAMDLIKIETDKLVHPNNPYMDKDYLSKRKEYLERNISRDNAELEIVLSKLKELRELDA